MEEARRAVSAPDFWQGLYDAGNDGWELGGPAPPLESWLDGGGAFPSATSGAAARVAVPGAGRGHDARLLARRGYRVTAFDWAPAATEAATRLARAERVAVDFQARDVFTLGASYPAAFDAVWEYTCFCAIDPARRQEYLAVLAEILRPGGQLLACLYPLREGTDGPPFPVSLPDVERMLAPRFSVRSSAAPARSAERRQGLEWLVLAERR